MAVLNEIFLGLEIALFIVFVVLAATTLIEDRRAAREPKQRPLEHRRSRPRPA
jgi:hypothetical protein